ncbi:ImmA/IrrE family metallo-endopeptidase [Fictibacillus sp. 5RED26]|uniref:ImmA/IrrE family metallo-endopeptidase n=1 Tax=Fictibacillus sp. 5RED26 TaxID=2745876 RepID=UPI0018CD4D8C|nr:ImmA/IrrE family metallo-endopeptidase [Fictibacillus sp. 5RED26]MBH0156777.1 ImmA/IrrE family metallo-endopeptidase [Fictibacillus sp. 5RED26]
MSVYVANPTSRKSIRDLTYAIRRALDLHEEKFFPIVQFLELLLPKISPSFSMEVVPIEELKYEYGVTFPEKNVIRLREDVYLNAIEGIARDRFTVAHEIGHLFLHKPGSIALARSQKADSIPAFKSPEWQANTFAAELLAPAHLIKGLSIKEVALSCGVSLDVARIQIKNI